MVDVRGENMGNKTFCSVSKDIMGKLKTVVNDFNFVEAEWYLSMCLASLVAVVILAALVWLAPWYILLALCFMGGFFVVGGIRG